MFVLFVLFSDQAHTANFWTQYFGQSHLLCDNVPRFLSFWFTITANQSNNQHASRHFLYTYTSKSIILPSFVLSYFGPLVQGKLLVVHWFGSMTNVLPIITSFQWDINRWRPQWRGSLLLEWWVHCITTNARSSDPPIEDNDAITINKIETIFEF